MIRIEEEQRPDILRQIAILLDRENRRLHQRNRNLTIRNAELEGADAAAIQLEIEQLQELLAQRERTIFGDSSERRPREASSSPAEPSKQTGHGPTEQLGLLEAEELLELPNDQRTCPTCSGSLEEMTGQAEESEEITVVQRRFVLVKRRRQKYRCRCNAAVVTAAASPKLIPGGRYSPEVAVEVAISKYLDHLPLERQCRIMARQGLTVRSQTLWDQIEILAGVLTPSYEALHQRVLSAPVVHADETHWRLMTRQENSKWWVWSVTSRQAVFYRLCGTRSHKAARSILAGYQGTVMCDGYAAYKTLARAGPAITLAHCWAHVRRKFIDAEPNYPIPCDRALELIGKLCAIDREVPCVDVTESPEVLSLRQQLRSERSKPILDELLAWAEEMRPVALPRSGLGKAITYLLGHWPGLSLFLEDPRIPLDNNLAERELRGVVIGRKNHYGSRSQRGTEVAAILYSLTESAKLVGAEPHSYLLEATRAALEDPGAVTLPSAPGT
jgi:transposase